jgi:uncharacterized damage-inducible protein DinB
MATRPVPRQKHCGGNHKIEPGGVGHPRRTSIAKRGKGDFMFRTIADFEKEWKEHSSATQKLFAALTDESLSQEVADHHRTLGRVAWHIVITIPEMMEKTGLKFEGISEHSPMPTTAAEIQRGYAQVSAHLLEEIKENWSDRDLRVEDDMYGQMWERGSTLCVLINHEIHHRGQMTVLMRQAGLPVPGIFGPSKEEWSQWGMTEPEI